MILKAVYEKGFVCEYEIFDKEKKAMGICGKPAVAIAKGKTHLCKECLGVASVLRDIEYRIKQKEILTEEKTIIVTRQQFFKEIDEICRNSGGV